jgi:hypothetical protein
LISAAKGLHQNQNRAESKDDCARNDESPVLPTPGLPIGNSLAKAVLAREAGRNPTGVHSHTRDSLVKRQLDAIKGEIDGLWKRRATIPHTTD